MITQPYNTLTLLHVILPCINMHIDSSLINNYLQFPVTLLCCIHTDRLSTSFQNKCVPTRPLEL